MKTSITSLKDISVNKAKRRATPVPDKSNTQSSSLMKDTCEAPVSPHTDDEAPSPAPQIKTPPPACQDKYAHLSARKIAALHKCWEGARASRERKNKDLEELYAIRKRQAASYVNKPAVRKPLKLVKRPTLSPVRALPDESDAYANFF